LLFDDSRCKSFPSFVSVFSFKLRGSTFFPTAEREAKFVELEFANPKWGELVSECGCVGVGASECTAVGARD
jgi:hypothetical protein